VLRYISVSLIAAIFTGAKGTVFRNLSAQVFQSSAAPPHSRVPSADNVLSQGRAVGGGGSWF